MVFGATSAFGWDGGAGAALWAPGLPCSLCAGALGQPFLLGMGGVCVPRAFTGLLCLLSE